MQGFICDQTGERAAQSGSYGLPPAGWVVVMHPGTSEPQHHFKDLRAMLDFYAERAGLELVIPCTCPDNAGEQGEGCVSLPHVADCPKAQAYATQ